MLSGTHWSESESLRRALLAQSHNAQIGLYFICVGTSSQMSHSALFPGCTTLIYPLTRSMTERVEHRHAPAKKEPRAFHSRGLQLPAFETFLSQLVGECWGDGD